jgi:hypothetical protein
MFQLINYTLSAGGGKEEQRVEKRKGKLESVSMELERLCEG